MRVAGDAAPYREPSLGRSLTELIVMVVPFVALWLAMLLSLRYSYWLCPLLAVPTSGFLVRLFMIQHYCGHGSFFHGRTHSMHHATPAIWAGGARATSTP